MDPGRCLTVPSPPLRCAGPGTVCRVHSGQSTPVRTGAEVTSRNYTVVRAGPPATRDSRPSLVHPVSGGLPNRTSVMRDLYGGGYVGAVKASREGPTVYKTLGSDTGGSTRESLRSVEPPPYLLSPSPRDVWGRGREGGRGTFGDRNHSRWHPSSLPGNGRLCTCPFPDAHYPRGRFRCTCHTPGRYRPDIHVALHDSGNRRSRWR